MKTEQEKILKAANQALREVLRFTAKLVPPLLSLFLMVNDDPYWAILIMLWFVYFDKG